jgi:hypothetical protein
MKFNKTVCIVVLFALLLLFKGNGIAQQKANQPLLENTWWISYNPLTLLEPEVPIAVSVMYKPSKWIGIVLDAGVFIARQDYSNDSEGNPDGFDPYCGFRFKPEIRFYIDGDRRGPRGFFVGLQGIIKRTITQKEEWLSRQNSSGQTIFNQLVDYKERKFVYGLGIIVGGEFVVGRPKRWMIELYGGMGLRNKNFTAIGLPGGISINYDKRDDLVERQFNIYQNGLFYTGTLGFKIGYRLK